MVCLKNGTICFELDSNGNLTHLSHTESGRDYAGGYGLWRIIYQDGLSLEEELLAEDAAFSSEMREDGSLLLKYVWKRGFEVLLTGRISEKSIRFDAELKNNSEKLILREFQFPMLKNLPLLPVNRLIWSVCGGQMLPDVSSFVDRCCSTAYVAQDNKALELSSGYPGCSAGMNFYLLDEQRCGLYLGSHDSSFQYTLHLMRKRKGEFDAAMVKYPFLKPGMSKIVEGYTVAPYSGTWHKGADIYKEWLNTWFAYRDIPESIHTSNGWQRIILRHQYGKILFRYDQLPEILKAGLGAGINTLFLFGWHTAGMDAMYPEYTCDESQGGFEALKKQVGEFQKGGGKVILYFNGQLIDMATEFYRTVGHRISIKRMNGCEHQEVYPFGGDGTGLRVFGNKNFVVACPACKEWHEVLKGFIDQAIALGVDGVFFDQLGYCPAVPCNDPAHGHEVPFLNGMKAKMEMIRELREYLKSRCPEMSLGIECISDATAQYVDYVHGWCGTVEPMTQNLTRYVIPELVLTDREIRDDTGEIEHRLNLAVVRGLRSDVEIYRCRATIDETPRYKAYMTKINRIRDRYRDLILNGEFLDTRGVECEHSALIYGVFRSGKRFAVVATQNSEDSLSASLDIPGARLIRRDSVGEAEVVTEDSGKGKMKITLMKNTLIVMEFEV